VCFLSRLVGGKLWGLCVANAITIRRRSPVYPSSPGGIQFAPPFLHRLCLDKRPLPCACPVASCNSLAPCSYPQPLTTQLLHERERTDRGCRFLQIITSCKKYSEAAASPTGRFMFLFYFLSFFSWLLFDLAESKWICYSICFWSLSSHPLI
jgi:hypothetical protein